MVSFPATQNKMTTQDHYIDTPANQPVLTQSEVEELQRKDGGSPMTPQTHSPLWRLVKTPSRIEIDCGDHSIAFTHARENEAQLIITAVNSHSALVTALERTLSFEQRIKACNDDGGRLLIADIRAALAQVKGGK